MKMTRRLGKIFSINFNYYLKHSSAQITGRGRNSNINELTIETCEHSEYNKCFRVCRVGGMASRANPW